MRPFSVALASSCYIEIAGAETIASCPSSTCAEDKATNFKAHSLETASHFFLMRSSMIEYLGNGTETAAEACRGAGTRHRCRSSNQSTCRSSKAHIIRLIHWLSTYHDFQLVSIDLGSVLRHVQSILVNFRLFLVDFTLFSLDFGDFLVDFGGDPLLFRAASMATSSRASRWPRPQ